MRVPVVIIGAGPAGLVLSHLLAQADIPSLVIENRSREYIEHRTRAGFLEARTVSFLQARSLAEHMLAVGKPHRGTEIRFLGERHRIPYTDLYGGREALVYPQQDLVADLVALRLAHGGAIEFEVDDVRIHDADSDAPSVSYHHAGETVTVDCDFVTG